MQKALVLTERQGIALDALKPQQVAQQGSTAQRMGGFADQGAEKGVGVVDAPALDHHYAFSRGVGQSAQTHDRGDRLHIVEIGGGQTAANDQDRQHHHHDDELRFRPGLDRLGRGLSQHRRIKRAQHQKMSDKQTHRNHQSRSHPARDGAPGASYGQTGDEQE